MHFTKRPFNGREAALADVRGAAAQAVPASSWTILIRDLFGDEPLLATTMPSAT